MEGSKEESELERFSTSRLLNAGGTIAASSSSLGLIDDGDTSRELEEDLGRPKTIDIDTRLKTIAGGSTRNLGEVSLRDFLDKPGRSIDFLECLHIFRQVVEAVNLAHCQGVVVNNIRPSCFVMSTFNCVSFVESASCSGLASDRMSAGAFESSTHAAQLSLVEELEGRRELDLLLNAVGERRDFRPEHIFNLECNWYACPEEGQERQSVYTSDVYRLGVLLFELFCMFENLEEKIAMMSNLRHRVLPPQILLKWPKVASFCLLLLHPQPSSRPKVSEVLQSEFLNTKGGSLEEREVAIKSKEEIASDGLLLEFLLQLQRGKQETADMLHDTILFLSHDIEEVESQRVLLMKRDNFFELEKGGHHSVDKLKYPLPSHEINEDSASSASRKRIRTECKDVTDVQLDKSLCGDPILETNLESKEKIILKNSRIMNNFKKLEAAYFSSRCKPAKPVGQHARKLQVSNTGRGSTDKTEGSSVDDLIYKEGESGSRMGEWIYPFLDGLCKFLSFSKFRVRAELKQGDLLSSSNLICSLAFDRDRHFFASVGVNKKIKVFECDAIINDDRDIHYPVVEMVSRSKLSNVCWNSYIKNQIASSDFEGVVQVWDVTRSQGLLELREHEKRVWSVDYSLTDPTMLASGSDDGTVKLWNINQGGSTCTIRTKANVCTVQFSPDSSRIIAIGSADHNVYCYDLRNTRVPLCTLVGHAKTVSYVKFVESSTLVSSSTDNSLKLWDLSTSTSRVLDSPARTFTGHTNVKNFVGLSISDGYIATGSETNEVFVYHKAFPMPVFSYNFGCIDPISGLEENNPNQFISCVCWRGQSRTLVAASSSGNIKFLEMI